MNMKRLLLVVCLILNVSCVRREAMRLPAIYDREWADSDITISKSEMVGLIGESHLYKIRWLGLTVAEAELENLGVEDYKGKECYHVAIRVRTHKVLSLIFKVRDEFHSYIDRDTLKPLAYTVKRREGGYNSESEMIFDYDNNKVIYRSLTDGSKKEIKIEPDYNDFISCFYRFRVSDFDKDSYIFKAVQRAKIWQVDIEIIKKGFLEMRGHGTPKVILVKITASSGEEKAKGSAWIWFSGDEKKVPLLGQFNVDIPVVGTVRIVLEA